MAAPEYVPVAPGDRARRSYASPEHVPDAWVAQRPAELAGRQPEGALLGHQGPDQGFALHLAERFRDRLRLTEGERPADVLAGCVGVATRRASLFGRAPVVHDLTIAFTIWGYLDPAAPPELVTLRTGSFTGVAHHYADARAVADAVPDDTLRMTHQQVQSAYPARWRELVGA